MKSKLKKTIKYKTILYFAGGIIQVNIICFDIIKKKAKECE